MPGANHHSPQLLAGKVADHVNAMLAYWDNEEVCRFANKAYMDWFGKSPEEMIGKIKMKELLGPLYTLNEPYIKKALEGQKQVFERDIILPNGECRHSLATYHPDIQNGKVAGFFVHVADVSPVKQLEAKLLAAELSRKRAILRSVIEAREEEKEMLAYSLTDGISQTLAYCNMMLQEATAKDRANDLLHEVAKNTQKALQDLNVVSRELSVSAIHHFGFEAALQDYFADIKKRFGITVVPGKKFVSLETINMRDRVSVYRIIQSFLLSIIPPEPGAKISLILELNNTMLHLLFDSRDKINMAKDSRQYADMISRITYYHGDLKEKHSEGVYSVEITISLDHAD